jgi:hypothetical protein
MSLTPIGCNLSGRTDFLIHGDSIDAHHQGNASQGCIILPPEVRKAIWDTNDRTLSVEF